MGLKSPKIDFNGSAKEEKKVRCEKKAIKLQIGALTHEIFEVRLCERQKNNKKVQEQNGYVAAKRSAEMSKIAFPPKLQACGKNRGE